MRHGTHTGGSGSREARGALAERWNRLWGHDLFISYSRRDALGYALQLDRKLTEAGFHCFRDEDRIWVGDHLPSKLLTAARRSRVLLVVLSPRALESRWVQEELATYLAVGGERQVIPLFFDRRHPEGLPNAFGQLRDYRGLYDTHDRLQQAEPDLGLLGEIRQRFQGIRQRTLRRGTLAALALGLGVTAMVGWSRLQQARAETVQHEWRERAAGFLQAHRNDMAELALARAHAAGAATGEEDLQRQYREARAKRKLVPLRTLDVLRSERLQHWDAWKDEPYAVIYDPESGKLGLAFQGIRRALPSCSTEPHVASRGSWLAWACGCVLYRLRLDAPDAVQQRALDQELKELVFSAGELRLLERTDTQVHIRGLNVGTLAEQWKRSFPLASPHALVHLCPDAEFLAYSITADARALHLQRWQAGAAAATATLPFLEDLRALNTGGIMLGSVSQDSRCERFILSYAPWTWLGGQPQDFRWLLLAWGDLPPLRFLEPGLREPRVVDRRTGSEAVYLNDSGDLRRLPVVPPMVVAPEVRTLASRVQSFAVWSASEGDSSLQLISMNTRDLEVHETDALMARYPVGVEEALRIRVSSEGSFIAVEGREHISLWKRAVAARPDGIPTMDALSRELGLSLRKDGSFHYTALLEAPHETAQSDAPPEHER
ncbi:toll/interleukin-1 receptor domain-containing protein [Corallococcus exercitus]|uniref:toll/interleukin-1 receptor domain-containing protein n=1 Tax=Corallococcus exercitus TaxID=2316736 RepID=UPI003462C205